MSHTSGLSQKLPVTQHPDAAYTSGVTVSPAQVPHFGTVINQQGRVVVPVEVRSALGLEPGDRVDFVLEDGVVRLVTAQMLAAAVWANNHGGDTGDSTRDVRAARSRDQTVAAARRARTRSTASDADKDPTATDLLGALGVA
jgi:AbrB family looped-hinge helix DNA binding protein